MRRFLQGELLENRVLLAADTAAFHNALSPTDVDQDGLATPTDVLVVINELMTGGARDLRTSAPAPRAGEGEQSFLYDVDGDNFLAPNDALLVINELMGEGETGGFMITQTNGNTTVHEVGTTDTFTVVLTMQPATNVVLNITSADQGEATVSPSTLTFTNANWNTPQTVTVTGVNDNVIDGDQVTPITISVNDALSDDNFDDAPNQVVNVTTTVEDLLAIRLSARDLNGNAITQVNAGSRFLVRSSVQDIRTNPNPGGVFAAYQDITFDGDKFVVVADPNFPSAQDSTFVPVDGDGDFGFNIEFLDLYLGATTGDLTTDLVGASCAIPPGSGFDTCLNDIGSFSAVTVPPPNPLAVKPQFQVAFEVQSVTSDDDMFTVNENATGVMLNVLANDSLVGSPSGQQMTIANGFADELPFSRVLLFGNNNAVSEESILFSGAQFNVINNGTLGIQAQAGDLNPANGTATINNNGTPSNPSDDFISYTPNGGFVGIDTFTYTATDNNGATVRATVTVTVAEVNDPPNAVDDTFQAVEDTPQPMFAGLSLSQFFAQLTSNDTPGPPSESGQSLTVISINGQSVNTPRNFTGQLGGVLAIDPGANTVSYTPGANRFGNETFTYTIQDDATAPLTDTATITITVSEVNDPPVAANDSRTTAEDTQLVLSNLLNNDNAGPQEPSQTISITSVSATSALGGTVTRNGNVVTYTPPADANTPDDGVDTFTYTITDNGTTGGNPQPLSATATVTITITEVNDAPIANDDSTGTAENVPLVINIADLTNNDAPGPATADDEAGQTLTFTLGPTNTPGGGTVVRNGGQLTYTPAAGFNGTDTFTYTITDNGTTNGVNDFKSDTATVAISVGAVNDPPTAGDDSGTTPEDTPRTFTASFLLSNDSAGPPNESGQTLTISLPSGGTEEGGTVTLNNNGTPSIPGDDFIEYSPPGDFFGTDTFTYTITDDGFTNGLPDPLSDTATVTVTVTAVNDPPVGSNKMFEVSEASMNNVLDVTMGDTPGPANESGQTLTITNVTQGTLGVVSLNAGVVTYTPNNGVAMGTDTFTYTITDNGTTNGANDFKSATFTVTVEIIPLRRPNAANDTATVAEDSDDNIINVLGNDFATPDFDIFIVAGSIGNFSAGGSAFIDDNGTSITTDDFIRYTPAANFFGVETFTYTVNDTADPGEGGPGNDGPDTATVTVTVTAVNDPVTTMPDQRSTNEDVVLNIAASTLTANDSPGPANESGQTLTITAVSSPSAQGGTVSLIGTTVVYTPAADFNGTDTFTYTVRDNGQTNGVNDFSFATETVTVTVNAVNDPPVPVGDTGSTAEDTATTFNAVDLVANDAPGPATATDEAGQNLTLTAVGATSANLGAVSLNNGIVTYTPAANFNGVDTFTYTVTDDHPTDPRTALGTVTVTVTEVNDPPVANNDNRTTAEDTALQLTTANLTANDTRGPANESGQTLTISSVSSGSSLGGTVTLSGGVVTYTPPANLNTPANGVDTFTYTITDNGTTNGQPNPLSSTATVTVTITEVNDAPTAVADNATTAEDTPLSLTGAQLTGNDSRGPANESGQTLTIIAVNAAGVGAVSLSGGNVTYTPPANFFGVDTFTYTVQDNGTTNGVAAPLTSTTTVTVNVTEVNDAPVAGDDQQLLVIVQPLVINKSDLLANDSPGPANESGQTLTLVPNATSASGGTIVDNGNGTLTYTPPAGFSVSDTFQYTITDNGTTNGVNDFKSDVGTVTILHFRTNTISGFVYVDVDNDGHRDANEPGIGGVQVSLSGFDFLGRSVNHTATTNADGLYSFPEIAPTLLPTGAAGSSGYTISASTPRYMNDGQERGGNQGGADVSVNDQIRSVHLDFLGTVDASQNNFGERGVAAQFLTIAELFASSSRNGFVVATNLAGDQFWHSILDGFEGADGVEMRFTGPASNRFSQVEVRVRDGATTHVRTINTATSSHFRIMGTDGANGYVLRYDGTVEDLLGFTLASAAPPAEGEAPEGEMPVERFDAQMLAAGRGRSAGDYASAVDSVMHRYGGGTA